MKKSIILSIAAAAAFATAAFTANTVSAATTTGNTEKDQTATVTLTAGENTDGTKGVITLTSAPDLSYKATINANAVTTADYTTEAPVTVENPGVAATWAVQAQLGNFTGTNGTLGDTKITVASGSDNNITSNDMTLQAGGAAQPFAASAKTDTGFTGVGTTSINGLATKISIAADNVAGTYTAPLTWTLSATPSDDSTTPESNN